MLRIRSFGPRVLPALVLGAAPLWAQPQAPSGTATDPTRWQVHVQDTLASLEQMQRRGLEQAGLVRAGNARLAEAVAACERAPQSEAAQRALLEESLALVGVVGAALQAMLDDEPIVRQALERDTDRLARARQTLEQDAGALASRLDEAQRNAGAAAAEADRLLAAGAPEADIEAQFREQKRWERARRDHERSQRNLASKLLLLERSSKALRGARLRKLDELDALHDMRSELDGAVGSFEVIAEHMETKRICEALDKASGAERALRSEAPVDGLDEAARLLASLLLHEPEPADTVAEESSFDRWMRERRHALQAKDAPAEAQR